MCNVSNVYDSWKPYVPVPTGQPLQPQLPNITVTPYVQPVAFPFSDKELRELIDAFHAAVKAAKTLDRLTKQPDCEDPDKAKLEDRVAELERRLDESDK